MAASAPLARFLPILFMFGAGLAKAAAIAVLEASLGFGGYATPGAWAPLWIVCNEAPRSSQVEVARIGFNGVELGRESFPVSSSRLECPVLISGDLVAIELSLISDNRTLARLSIAPKARLAPGPLVLSLALPAAVRVAVASAKLPDEHIVVVPLTASEFPANELSFDGVSAVVAAYPDDNRRQLIDAGLNSAQTSALRSYLASGGIFAALAEADGRSFWLNALDLPAPAATDSSLSFGFGRYSLVGQNEAALAASWGGLLAAVKIGSSLPFGTKPLIEGLKTAPGESPATRDIHLILSVVLGCWCISILSVAFFSRKRFEPLVVVALVGLAAVLAGAGALNAYHVRGASWEALILAPQETDSALAALGVEPYQAEASLSWLGSAALGPVSVFYGNEGTTEFKRWNHYYGRALLSPVGTGTLTLAGHIGREDKRRLFSVSFPALSSMDIDIPPSTLASDGAVIAPPAVEALSPLYFLGPDGVWWEKEPGEYWLPLSKAPSRLDSKVAWLEGLVEGRKDTALLASYASAALVGFRFQGSYPRGEVLWVTPLPIGVGQ